MVETLVTRSGQITLTKDIRKKLNIKEGDSVNLNSIGELVIISKKNINAFEIGDFLPDNFSKTIENTRKLDISARLKKLRIIE